MLLKLIASRTIAITERLAREIGDESRFKTNSIITYLS
jgi:hypothetical protein